MSSSTEMLVVSGRVTGVEHRELVMEWMMKTKYNSRRMSFKTVRLLFYCKNSPEGVIHFSTLINTRPRANRR